MCEASDLMVTLDHSKQDMTALDQAEGWVYTGLYHLVHAIFVVVALAWLALRRTSRAVAWLAHVFAWVGAWLWRVLRFVVSVYRSIISVTLAVVWVFLIMIVWLGGAIYQIVVVVVRRLGALAGWIWGGTRRMGRWALKEFSEPVTCLTCVTMGVISANALPTLVLLEISPLEWINMTFPPLAIAAIAARVFDMRAYRRWRGDVRAQLGTRMLRAYSDGAMWPLLLRQRG